MQQEWITDRLPTAADGDEDGEVRLANSDRSDYRIVEFEYVHPGAPWQHTSSWAPPAEPDSPAVLGKTSMINCRIDGPPPSPHQSWSNWFDQEGSKGILHGLRISAMSSRGGKSGVFAPAEPDRITALEQRITELETKFWKHSHPTAVELTTEPRQ